MGQTETWAIGLAFFCAVLAALGQLLFKLGSANIALSLTSWLANWKVIGGMVFYGTSAILFIVALKHGNLSILYPIIATSYVWVTILSIKLLNEPFPPVKWFGIILILGGVSIIIR